MDVSFIAFNRIVENKAAADPKYRRELERTGRPLLSQARLLSDAELLARLRAVGIRWGRSSFRKHCERAFSAEEVCETVVTPQVRERFQHKFDHDWVWFALTVLWERWFPELPSYEQLDDRMQAGYSVAECSSSGSRTTRNGAGAGSVGRIAVSHLPRTQAATRSGPKRC